MIAKSRNIIFAKKAKIRPAAGGFACGSKAMLPVQTWQRSLGEIELNNALFSKNQFR